MRLCLTCEYFALNEATPPEKRKEALVSQLKDQKHHVVAGTCRFDPPLFLPNQSGGCSWPNVMTSGWCGKHETLLDF